MDKKQLLLEKLEDEYWRDMRYEYLKQEEMWDIIEEEYQGYEKDKLDFMNGDMNETDS